MNTETKMTDERALEVLEGTARHVDSPAGGRMTAPPCPIWSDLERQFQEQIAGTTPPKDPEPVSHADELPRPWPEREGVEL